MVLLLVFFLLVRSALVLLSICLRSISGASSASGVSGGSRGSDGNSGSALPLVCFSAALATVALLAGLLEDLLEAALLAAALLAAALLAATLLAVSFAVVV